MTALKLPERLQNHRGFARTFQPGKLTLGLIAPFKGYPDSPVPEMDDFATVIKAADQSGIATLWVRDVPFYDPSFGDVAQIYDPSVTLGYLAALTQNVALGSAGY
ncbi:luciferase-like monooxygenase domain protein, partial [Haemophilus parainfluenzae HK2019]